MFLTSYESYLTYLAEIGKKKYGSINMTGRRKRK